MIGEAALDIAVLYAVLVGCNLPAPWLGLRFDDEPDPRVRFRPRPFVIPLAWFVLFALLGVAKTLTDRADGPTWPILALAITCATYAYYTLGLAALSGVSASWFGLVGNAGVVVVATATIGAVAGHSPAAAALVVPVIVWTAFATWLIVQELRLVHHHGPFRPNVAS